MDYMTVKQAAEKWERSVRWVQVLCQTDGVPGAVRPGRDWLIPKDADRPPDRRKREHRKKRNEQKT